MSSRTRQRKSFAVELMLYNRPIHPELYTSLRSETTTRRAYEASVHLLEGGHLISFTCGDNHLTELFCNRPSPLPERGQIEHLVCRGERYHECEPANNLRYMISTQEEQLPIALYNASKQEIVDYAEKRELMMVSVPGDDIRQAYTGVLDVERRAGELLVQSYHLFDDNRTVVKTQGIIEITRRPRMY